MAKKKAKAFYSICTECHEPIDLDTIQRAIAQDTEFIHTCGRVLHRGGTNAEVPIANHDDVSGPNYDGIGDYDGPPTGD